MSEIIGLPTSRKAKPMIMTFYDRMKDYPYTATFYVRDETPESDCLELINAICPLSLCVLSKYIIGYKKYWVSDFDERFKTLLPYAIGTYKWTIKYRLDSAIGVKCTLFRVKTTNCA